MMAPTINALAIVALAAAVLSACGRSPAPTPVAAAASEPAAAPASPKSEPPKIASSTAPTPAAVAKAASDLLAPPARPYDARGRRDPFDNLELQLQQKDKEKGRTSGFTVASTKLTGIVRGESLLALVETPDGVGYILKPGDTLGDGRLLEIARDSAVFTVAPKGGSASRVTLKIAAD